MRWLRFLAGGGSARKRSPWNNVDASGALTCGQVTDQLLVGGELGPRDWAALSDYGVSVVVNLQQETQDVFAPDEPIDGYLWLPSPDGRAPSLEQLAQGVTFLRAAIQTGQKALVHCKAGQGRAPLLCACYLIAEGFTPLEATTHLSRARPSTQLTPEQSARLREFAARFGRNGAQSIENNDINAASAPQVLADGATSAPDQAIESSETNSNNAAKINPPLRVTSVKSARF